MIGETLQCKRGYLPSVTGQHGTYKMKEISPEQYRLLKRINWDYNIPIEDMFAVVCGEKEHAGHWNETALLVRMIEHLNWYDILKFYNPETIGEKLTPELLGKIWRKDKRVKYEELGKILRGEPVAFTKWGAEYREQCKSTLFSNRWYST